MTNIKCRRKVATVVAIFAIDYSREMIKETEEITFNFTTHILLLIVSYLSLHE